MKTLLLIRHAKSSHDDPHTSDHDRPLNERGLLEAPLVGRRLVEARLIPDWIVCSTARRAQETARLLAAACEFDRPLDLRRELYLAAPDAMIRTLRSLPENPDRVALVAHNPGLEEYASLLTDDDVAMATSTLVEIRLPLESWNELTPGTAGRLVQVWRPRDDQ